jgi:hypothetical protein
MVSIASRPERRMRYRAGNSAINPSLMVPRHNQ